MKQLRNAILLSRLVLLLMVPFAPTVHAENQAQLPENLPFQHGLGYELFQDNCAQCHGADLAGTDEGPPLMHGYYKPGHHSDAAFFRAIQQGSPQHHWSFGNMKPVEGIDQQQAKAIVEFVRWYQQENGLY